MPPNEKGPFLKIKLDPFKLNFAFLNYSDSGVDHTEQRVIVDASDIQEKCFFFLY